mmetsp:Transcript_88574/g.156808  ORF Transcript_88574/g.156808 Transcript_88574/m.156808 type:complete len:232 (+) Transcript_88574:55-750(+)
MTMLGLGPCIVGVHCACSTSMLWTCCCSAHVRPTTTEHPPQHFNGVRRNSPRHEMPSVQHHQVSEVAHTSQHAERLPFLLPRTACRIVPRSGTLPLQVVDAPLQAEMVAPCNVKIAGIEQHAIMFDEPRQHTLRQVLDLRPPQVVRHEVAWHVGIQIVEQVISHVQRGTNGRRSEVLHRVGAVSQDPFQRVNCLSRIIQERDCLVVDLILNILTRHVRLLPALIIGRWAAQ